MLQATPGSSRSTGVEVGSSREASEIEEDDPSLARIVDIVETARRRARQDRIAALDDFRRTLETVSRSYVRDRGRLVVFVDDLDRCLPEKAIEVLEALKLFLDVEGWVFVLALDAEAIQNAIRHRYQGDVKAREYLKKIVQVPFILPPIDPEPMRTYVLALAPALPDPRCAEVFAVGLGSNPARSSASSIFYCCSCGWWNDVPSCARRSRQHGWPRSSLSSTPIPTYTPWCVCIRATCAIWKVISGRAARAAGRAWRAPKRPNCPRRCSLSAPGPSCSACCCAWTTKTPASTCSPARPAQLRDAHPPGRAGGDAGCTRDPRPFEPELVAVLAGPFLMGTSPQQVEAMLKRYDWAKKLKADGVFDREQPQHEATLAAFEIGRYPVSNAEYAAFVEAAGVRAPSHWQEGHLPEDIADHIMNLTWHDALAYLQWLAERREQSSRCPPRPNGRRPPAARMAGYGPGATTGTPPAPTANRPAPAKPPHAASIRRAATAHTARLIWPGTSGNGAAACGAIIRKSRLKYPYRPDDGRENLEAGGLRILRGGSWADDNPGIVRSACRTRSTLASASTTAAFVSPGGLSNSTLSPVPCTLSTVLARLMHEERNTPSSGRAAHRPHGHARICFSQGFPIPGYCCPALAIMPSTPNSVKKATTNNTINAGRTAARMALPTVRRWVTCTALT